MASQTSTNAPLPDVSTAETTFREVDNITLHTVSAGNPDDPLVVFLHGFPEFWYQWNYYVEPFVDAGYRVLVPDQRGYNRSDKPVGVRAYRLGELCTDMIDLIATEDRETAHVVGHDSGAVVGWHLALRHPDTVGRLGLINVPHPTVLEQVLTSNLTQLRKSWYMFFFQLPRLSEWYVRRNEYGFFETAMRDGSRAETFSETDFERYRRAWEEKGAVTGMLNWYRAFFRHSEEPPREQVEAPTLIIWGENDQALIPEMASKSVDYCTEGRLEQFSDATHWIPHEYPEQVTNLLLDHLNP